MGSLDSAESVVLFINLLPPHLVALFTLFLSSVNRNDNLHKHKSLKSFYCVADPLKTDDITQIPKTGLMSKMSIWHHGIKNGYDSVMDSEMLIEIIVCEHSWQRHPQRQVKAL